MRDACRWGVASLLSGLLLGCSLAPAYTRPPAPVPTAWTDGRMEHVGDATAVELLEWRRFVVDEQLRAFVAQALEHNRGLRQTILDVEAARAEYRIQRSTQLPLIQLEAGSTRQRTSSSTAVERSDQAGVGLAAFEIDLFGRMRSLSDAGMQEYLATEDAARSAEISLVADVIQAWLVRDGAQRRYLLGVQVLEARQASLALVEQRRAVGLADDLEYQNAVSLVRQVDVDLERIDRQFRQAGNALALLAGTVDATQVLPSFPAGTHVLVQAVDPGLPSTLLDRRPDIRAAEHRLRARNASIGAARAAFFPRITLTGFLGSSSAALSDLFGAGQRSWSFAPQMTVPIFDAGGNRANLDLVHARRDIALAAYEHAIQVAFREVSDALAAIDTLRREEDAQQALAQANAEAMRLAALRHRSGADDDLRLLDAQRSALASRMGLIEVQTERQVAQVSLFRVLGGGWPEAVLEAQVSTAR